MARKGSKCLLAAFLIAIPVLGTAQVRSEFKEASDSLAVLLKDRTGVRSSLSLNKILKRKGKLDLYFSRSLADYPWRPGDIRWFRGQVESLFPEEWSKWQLGEIFTERTPLRDLQVSPIGNDGSPSPYLFPGRERKSGRLVQRVGVPECPRGLDGRHIALWQSHGMYFDDNASLWTWQRPKMWRTVEDMYTQSYVLPFLIPMLERAGACVMTPRERDVQRDEAVADNDASFDNRSEGCRRKGTYSDLGRWESIPSGFADRQQFYHLGENPFTMGTARKSLCTSSATPASTAVWKADFPRRGSYAVYVSYVTLPESSTCARYRVQHLGGTSEFIVNQKMGGGTWIYLGTFEFEGEGSVTLDNSTPKGRSHSKGSVVTADAVRFGGGFGKVVRGPEDTPAEEWITSGYPAYAEGALYSEIWYGADPKVYADWETEYVRDYASRGAWVKWLKDDKGVPFDLSLAFHTDAGVTPDDRIIGTLGIYTLMADGSSRFSDGTHRMACRLLTDRVQSQIVSDLRLLWNPDWTRRPNWNRSYSESRTTDVPAVLLELLSHQNFEDMKYGLDPRFRFDVCRSIYKAILKTVADLYNRPYTVEPLPVRSFSALLSPEGKCTLSWLPSEDPLEPTAAPESYIVYTRKDSLGFDNGVQVQGCSFKPEIEKGHIYSFRVEAVNAGGRSFPSETLAVGIPDTPQDSSGPVLVVNNFTRISGPTWFDTPSYAGFDPALDGGVPCISDISFIGEVYQARRELGWDGSLNPGFGACSDEYAGLRIAGNSFDFVSEHGKALMQLGHSFCSQSSEAFRADPGVWSTLDLICGKQVRTALGGNCYEVFPESLCSALRKVSEQGCNLIVSGANICTDAWDRIFPLEADSLRREHGIELVREVLGIKRVNGFGARDGRVTLLGNALELWHSPCEDHYCVERCDAIAPVSASRCTIIAQYPQDRTSAGILYNGDGYKAASFGFPLEALRNPDAMRDALEVSLSYFENNNN